jgi:CubicO group peptidase (beta-lactamase class C family)
MLSGRSVVSCIAIGTMSILPVAPAHSTEPSAAVKEYRLHMFDAPVRTLANRTIELMFDTARVEPGTRASRLPKATASLDFTYECAGVTHPALDVLDDTSTDAMLILKNGKIVFEHYLNRTDARTHFNSYSMAKSINSILVGLALADGQIRSVKDPLLSYVPEFKDSAYDGTTLQDLLEMRSGVEWNDNFFVDGSPARNAHLASWVEGKARYADFASATRRAHPPGTVFNYNTMDAAVIGLAVERAVGKPISRYLGERLWKPGGMESYGFYLIDGPPGIGREFSGGGFNAVLRDYGRLGLLMLERGRLDGRQILSPSYVDESTRPSTISDRETGETGLGYAYFWWPILGSRAFTALGGEGQFIYVDPSTRTVIVKLSHQPIGPDGTTQDEEALSFFAAASRWVGRRSGAGRRQ